MAAPSPTTILVREVADDCLSHGDVTFAIGFAVIIGGGILVLLGASLLRVGGLI